MLFQHVIGGMGILSKEKTTQGDSTAITLYVLGEDKPNRLWLSWLIAKFVAFVHDLRDAGSIHEIS